MLQICFITIFAYKTASHQQRSVIDYVEIFDSPTRSEVMQSISAKLKLQRIKGKTIGLHTWRALPRRLARANAPYPDKFCHSIY